MASILDGKLKIFFTSNVNLIRKMQKLNETLKYKHIRYKSMVQYLKFSLNLAQFSLF